MDMDKVKVVRKIVKVLYPLLFPVVDTWFRVLYAYRWCQAWCVIRALRFGCSSFGLEYENIPHIRKDTAETLKFLIEKKRACTEYPVRILLAAASIVAERHEYERRSLFLLGGFSVYMSATYWEGFMNDACTRYAEWVCEEGGGSADKTFCELHAIVEKHLPIERVLHKGKATDDDVSSR